MQPIAVKSSRASVECIVHREHAADATGEEIYMYLLCHEDFIFDIIKPVII